MFITSAVFSSTRGWRGKFGFGGTGMKGLSPVGFWDLGWGQLFLFVAITNVQNHLKTPRVTNSPFDIPKFSPVMVVILPRGTQDRPSPAL